MSAGYLKDAVVRAFSASEGHVEVHQVTVDVSVKPRDVVYRGVVA
jgi:hypothetical protein